MTGDMPSIHERSRRNWVSHRLSASTRPLPKPSAGILQMNPGGGLSRPTTIGSGCRRTMPHVMADRGNMKSESKSGPVWNTPEGIEVKPLYTAADLGGIAHLNTLPG